MHSGAEPQTWGCLTAPCALPGHCPLSGEQAQHHQPLPCIGACCGEVCVRLTLPGHSDTCLHQPPTGLVLSAAAAEQAGGEWALLGDCSGSVHSTCLYTQLALNGGYFCLNVTFGGSQDLER